MCGVVPSPRGRRRTPAKAVLFLWTHRSSRVPDGPWYLLARNPEVRGTDLRDAQATRSERGWATVFVLSQTAAKRFESYTAANIGRRAAIVLDAEDLKCPQ